jgi:hypothetical protein
MIAAGSSRAARLAGSQLATKTTTVAATAAPT